MNCVAYKEIPLNKGAVTIVDESDYERLMKFKWRISEKGYAMRTQVDKGKASGVLMHRMLLDPPKGFMADHINGDRLDNRRCNLRLANALENSRNRANNHNSRSKYKGVAWKVENNKWQARIRIVGKQHHIGLFDTEEDAAYAYNQAAKLQHGDFSRLNVLPDNYVPPVDSGECPLCHKATTREPVSGDEAKRLKTAIGGLRSIAYGEAHTWPNCSSREVAKQALADCGGEKYVD